MWALSPKAYLLKLPFAVFLAPFDYGTCKLGDLFVPKVRYVVR